MSVSGRLIGRRALVTGATSGIGRAVARTLAMAGAHVIATGRRAERLAELERETSASAGLIIGIAGDLTVPAFVKDLAARSGDLDFLVANAGSLVYAPFLDLDMAQVRAMFEANVFATQHLIQCVCRGMVARKSGHVVVVSSIAGREVFPFSSAYSATKRANSAFADGLRLEMRSHGIKVSEVSPGSVATEFRDRLDHPEVLAAIAARRSVPLSPEDVAETILFALSAPRRASVDLIEVRPHEAP